MARLKADDPEARSKIMVAAEELFAARGYAGTSVRDIASAAGVNGAMIHYYFGNKEGLYHSILETAASEVRSLLKEAAGDDQPTRERLTRFIHAYATYIFGHPNLARIIHREMLAGGKHLKQVVQKQLGKNYAMLREIIREGVRRGELRPVDVDLTPLSLIGMIVFFQIGRPIISEALGKERYDEQFIRRISAHTADLFLNGAEAPTPSKKAARNPAGKQSRAGRRTQAK